MTQQKVGDLNGIWTWAFKLAQILVVVIAPAFSLLVGAVWSNSKAIERMEVNRMTNAEGLEIWKSIADVKQTVALIPKEAPPRWFVDRFDRLEQRVEQLSKDVSSLAKHIPKGG